MSTVPGPDLLDSGQTLGRLWALPIMRQGLAAQKVMVVKITPNQWRVWRVNAVNAVSMTAGTE